ncbi:hypothetical protein E5163_10315 [Marinicauda algicola]|uniref:Uncharacterized protein n=1 Tax=Marinicauda algicola TaxID=2029849 RepID=A0A4S2GYF5_9PROT|nr:hypothetical protein [Marinicauda algicola]TGY88217.1 hypothetical protein E5163_10315 [Marinicauda algicola]
MRFSLVSLAALCLGLGAVPAVAAQEHGHAHDDHAHGGDHGHAQGGHDHAAPDAHPSGVNLDAEPVGAVHPGEPAELTLTVTGPDGEPLGPDALAGEAGHGLNVFVVDEGLEDFEHFHPELGADGRISIRFTPEYARIYRVWADLALADTMPAAGGHDDHADGGHAHGGESHAHDVGHDHPYDESHNEGDADHHSDDGSIRLSDWVAAGEEAAPYLAPVNTLDAQAGGLAFSLEPHGEVTAGERVALTLTIDGQAAERAHLIGFASGARSMVEAAAEAGRFEVRFSEPGVHRLFVLVPVEGDELTVPFTLNVGG